MKKNQTKSPFIFLVLALCLMLTGTGKAQTVEELRKSASDLIKQNKYIEALPFLEKIAKADPNDAEIQFELGFALISKAATVTDEATRRQLRVQSRNAFLKSRSLGKDSPLLDGMIESISPDGVEKGKFSFNKEAEDFMRDAEASFAKGDLDDAFDKYQKALAVDPKIYYAALFSGDVFKDKGDFAQAEVWYKKAIAINPYIETAYRYSATPLMQQKKYDQALVRYIESYITEPYSKFAISGLTQWGQATGKRLGHPRMDIPKFEIGADGKAKTTINVNPAAMDSSLAWMSYVTTRENWRKEKFSQTFPNERGYRHSLQEEAEALRSVIKIAKDLKAKTPNPQFETLSKLDAAGCLEAFILMAIADEGIAQDHFKYLKANRDKLRQYVTDFVVQK